jgi:HlyD family secretion protein
MSRISAIFVDSICRVPRHLAGIFSVQYFLSKRPEAAAPRRRLSAGAAGAGADVHGRGDRACISSRPALQRFLRADGAATGGGAESPIALPPEIEMPPRWPKRCCPRTWWGWRGMPRGDVAVVAAPYGAGDARVAEILVAIGDRVARATLARLDNPQALESAVLTAEANLAVRQATLMQTRSAIEASRAEAQASARSGPRHRAEAANACADRGAVRARCRHHGHAGCRAHALPRPRRPSPGPRRRWRALPLSRSTNSPMSSSPPATSPPPRPSWPARMDLGRAEVVAPIAGTILDIHATPGQRPPAEGIMEMGDTGQMMAEVEIWQDRIAAVAPGQPVELAPRAGRRPARPGGEHRADGGAAGADLGRCGGQFGCAGDPGSGGAGCGVLELPRAITNLEAVARIDTGAAARAAA